MDVSRSISKEELISWSHNPTTIKIKELLNAGKKELESMILDGASLDCESAEKTALRTALMLGELKGLNTLLNLEVENA